MLAPPASQNSPTVKQAGIGLVTRFLVRVCIAVLFAIAPATAQPGTDTSALLSGEADPESFDLVALRFNDNAGFERLRGQLSQQFGIGLESNTLRKPSETLFASHIRLAAWLDIVGKCTDRSRCHQRVADVRENLQTFRVLRERLARGELGDGDGGQLWDAPVIERALAVDPVAKELLARAVRERLEPPEELKLFLSYELLALRRSNSEWLQNVLTSHGWLHFSAEQLGLPPDAQRAPVAAQVLRKMVPEATQRIPQNVDVALWIMYRNIPDADFKRGMLARALPFVQRGQSSSLFFSTMTDRLAVEASEPQIYGTETRCGAAKVLEYFPFVDPSNVDSRREAIGLPSLNADSRERRWIGQPCAN